MADSNYLFQLRGIIDRDALPVTQFLNTSHRFGCLRLLFPSYRWPVACCFDSFAVKSSLRLPMWADLALLSLIVTSFGSSGGLHLVGGHLLPVVNYCLRARSDI